LLGIGDSTVFKEIGKPYLDLYCIDPLNNRTQL